MAGAQLLLLFLPKICQTLKRSEAILEEIILFIDMTNVIHLK